MDVGCDLEVDVNGDEMFVVNKEILSSFSGRIRNLFVKCKSDARNLKVIFNEFPGGAGNFELAARFCYNNGKTEINPFNISSLHCVSHFMEIPTLLEQTRMSLVEIKYWTWSELLVSLKQCQDLCPVSGSSELLQRVLDAIAFRLSLNVENAPSCPSTSSPVGSEFRLSSGSRSTDSLKTSYSRATWWFEDIVSILKPNLIEVAIRSMVSQKTDQGLIVKFLLYYQKSRFATTTLDEKIEISETVIRTLHSLDTNAVPHRSLFAILRVCINRYINKQSRNLLEAMIGARLDHATLDDLLIPSPSGSKCFYNVNYVLRIVGYFLGKGNSRASVDQLKKIAHLMDAYLTEVAPDPCLTTKKFVALATALPDSARDRYDGVYHAIDLYLQVHKGLSEEEKVRICCYGLNYSKLSSEACRHLYQNNKFPSKSATQALAFRNSKLTALLFNRSQQRPVASSPCSSLEAEHQDNGGKASDQIVLFAGKLEVTDDGENLRSHLRGMQWRVVELERICGKMQAEMNKIMKSRLADRDSPKSLPRFCS